MTMMVRQIFIVAAISVAFSLACTYLLMSVFFPGSEALWFALSVAGGVPLVASIPTTWYFAQQRMKVDRLNVKLQAAHEELRQLHERAEHRASIDQMTGLLNRESFLTGTKFRRRRSDAGFLMMIDVDDFKQVNDLFGHQLGDAALQVIVSAIRKQIRKSDILGRLGGDEFALFVADLDPERAWDMAEDVRKAVEASKFEPKAGERHALTVSIGIAPAPARTRMFAIMDHADRSLYAAKHAGRNRVAYSHEDEPEVADRLIPVALPRAS